VPVDDLARMLEAALLRPWALSADIDALCDGAVEARSAAVVVLPVWVARARDRLAGAPVALCAAIAYPFGADSTRAKAAGVEQALRDGADEVEVVACVPALVAGDVSAARHELRALVDIVRARNATARRAHLVRAVLETCYLDDAGKRAAALAAAMAGCDSVVTTTGAGTGGATPHDVALLRGALPAEVGVKAAGTVRSLADVAALIAAGAARVAVASPLAVLAEAREGPAPSPGTGSGSRRLQ
jgi:deoxyribose-phosphate aldolase